MEQPNAKYVAGSATCMDSMMAKRFIGHIFKKKDKSLMSCKTRSLARSGCSGRKWKEKRTRPGHGNLNISATKLSTDHQETCYVSNCKMAKEIYLKLLSDKLAALLQYKPCSPGHMDVSKFPDTHFGKETLRLGSSIVIERFTEELSVIPLQYFELFIFSERILAF